MRGFQRSRIRQLSGLLAIALIFSAAIAVAEMQPSPPPSPQSPAVQELTGHLSADEVLLYQMDGLQRGRKLCILLERTGGNLDPLVLLIRPTTDFNALLTEARRDLDEAIDAGKDPLVELPPLFDKHALAWDDDSGTGAEARLSYEIPETGDYQIVVRSSLIVSNFGAFRMLIGLDEPKVITGGATSTGAKIAKLVEIVEPTSKRAKAVSIAQGTLTPQNSPLFFVLEPIRAGETIYIYVEATSGDLKPILFLADNGGKPIRSDNYNAAKTAALLTHTFETETRNFQIRLSSVPLRGGPTSGEYRLIAGIDAPEVASGQAEVQGAPVLAQPIPVRVGLSLHQIAGVDQKAERYDAVYDIMMRWEDPNLAFRPSSPEDSVRIFRHDDFIQYAEENNVLIPAFTLYNQQERRWSQNRTIKVMPDGRAIYFERFWARLQAPDFQFSRFPFDTQRFFARVDMTLPTRYFVLENLEQFSEVGTSLGEEEWVVSSFDTSIGADHPPGRSPLSSFTFAFYAHRHLNYYILRIFVPVLAIVIISWVTFYLRDYGKRVDLAGANLLVFIAFNFTIAGDLPRLGYLTLMDVILISTFVITAIVVIISVWLRHLHENGCEDTARKIDTYLIWLYPTVYLLIWGGSTIALLR